MLARLTTGLGIAARTGVVPLLLGARIAKRRRSGRPDGIPERQRGWATTSKAVLDEVFLATEFAMAPMISPRDRRRLRREIDKAIAFYDKNGWLDDPTGYHLEPRPLEVTRFDEFRSRWIPYRHMRFESSYEPHPGEPGRARWLSYTANRTGHAWLLKHPGPPRPWLVCIPGYRMGRPVIDFTGFRAGWLYKTLGLNVAIPVIPLHGPRRIGRRGGTASSPAISSTRCTPRPRPCGTSDDSSAGFARTAPLRWGPTASLSAATPRRSMLPSRTTSIA